ncbi:hypothetical protein KM043_016974 [Ampulex compressa]|nr:hypothetical protein KM043_016974 [Ampulex compressa]
MAVQGKLTFEEINIVPQGRGFVGKSGHEEDIYMYMRDRGTRGKYASTRAYKVPRSQPAIPIPFGGAQRSEETDEPFLSSCPFLPLETPSRARLWLCPRELPMGTSLLPVCKSEVRSAGPRGTFRRKPRM